MPTAVALAPVVSRLDEPTTTERVLFDNFNLSGASSEPAALASHDTLTAVSESSGVDAVLLATDERSQVASALPVRFSRVVTVGDTATLFGTDNSQAVRIVATVTKHPPQLRIRLCYVAGTSALPEDLLPSFRFLRALRRPYRLGLEIDKRSMGEPDELPGDSEFPKDLVEIVRSLALVQRLTHARFPLPRELAPHDLRTLRETESLLLGDALESRWSDASLGFSVIDPELLEVVGEGAPFRLEFTAPVIADIASHRVVLGEGRYVFRSAVIENYDELLRGAASGGAAGIKARLRPANDNSYAVRLLTPPLLGLNDSDIRPSVRVDDDLFSLAGDPTPDGAKSGRRTHSP